MTKVRSYTLCIVLILSCGAIPIRGFGQAPSAQVLQALTARYGAGFVNGSIVDSIAEGKITKFTTAGPKATFDVVVLRKGRNVQRIIKQPGGQVLEGSDGTRAWSSLAGEFSFEAHGPALQFIESQTIRSVHTLLRHQAEALTLHDLGVRANLRVIEAEDRQGRKTTYFLDNLTSTVTKLEFVVGQSLDPFSHRVIPNIERYTFSDFRTVQGLLTPFKIERFVNATKTEEMRFTTVRYNAALQDKDFRP